MSKPLRTSFLSTRNFLFTAMALALFGWINLERAFLRCRAGFAAHLTALFISACISYVVYRRCRIWWDLRVASTSPTASRLTARASIVPAAFLLATGYAFRALINAGSFTVVVIGTGVGMLVPWSRLSFCHDRFLFAQAVLLTGGTLAMATGNGYGYPIEEIVMSSILWALAAGIGMSSLFDSSDKTTKNGEERERVPSTTCESANH